MLPTIIVCSFISILFCLLGYFIWTKKKLHFIAGYDESTFHGDKEKLAKTVGLFSYFIGILTFVFPFGLKYIGSSIGLGYTIIIVVATIGLVINVNVKQ